MCRAESWDRRLGVEGQGSSQWVSSQAAPSPSCLVSLFSRLIMLGTCDWLSVSLASPPTDANNNRREDIEGKKNCI